jgi:hypothetical protein
MFSVAAATYLSLYPSMLIIPVILILTRKINENELIKVPIQPAGAVMDQVIGYQLSD